MSGEQQSSETIKTVANGADAASKPVIDGDGKPAADTAAKPLKLEPTTEAKSAPTPSFVAAPLAAHVPLPVNVTARGPVEVKAVSPAPKAKRGRKPRALVEAAAVTTIAPVISATALTPKKLRKASVAKAKGTRPAGTQRVAKPKVVIPTATTPKAVKPKAVQPEIAQAALRAEPRAAKIPVDGAERPAKTDFISKIVPGIASVFSQIKEFKNMDLNPNFADGIQNAMADAQDKAKTAFEKGSAMVGEYTEFAKGNVEAIVESGKVLTAGLQDLGSKLAAEGRTAFEAASADLKELAAARTPTDFLALQGEMAKKQFDGMVAYGSKSSEAFLKLVNDVFAPISGRVSVAVEKVKTATH